MKKRLSFIWKKVCVLFRSSIATVSHKKLIQGFVGVLLIPLIIMTYQTIQGKKTEQNIIGKIHEVKEIIVSNTSTKKEENASKKKASGQSTESKLEKEKIVENQTNTKVLQVENKPILSSLQKEKKVSKKADIKNVQKKISAPVGPPSDIDLDIVKLNDQERANKAEHHFGNGKAFSSKGLSSEAILEFERALEFVFNDYMIHKYLGGEYLKAGKKLGDSAILNKAVQTYTTAIDIKKSDLKLHLNRGKTFLELGSYQKALIDYNYFIDNNSPKYEKDLHIAYRDRGNVKMKMKNSVGAQKDFEKLIGLRPNDAKAFYNLGVSLRRNYNYSAAIEQYKIAIELDSTLKESFRDISNCYKHLNNKELQDKNWNIFIKMSD